MGFDEQVNGSRDLMNLVCLIVMFTGTGCCGPPRVWDFEDADVNAPPKCCRFASCGEVGVWRVVEDDGQKILAQVDRTQNSQRMALALMRDLRVRNVRLSARIRVVEGEKEQSGGIVWRYEDPQNFMLARLDVMDNRVCLYRVFKGHRTMFGVVKDLELEAGQWYTLRVEHKDHVVKVYLDDEIQFIRWSKHLLEPGAVGVWVKGDSAVHFDDFHLFNRDHNDPCRPEKPDDEVPQ
jgi:hypothetical protein